MNMPFVSVIIPTYNRHHIIRNTVKHLLNQAYPNYEIIVVDQTNVVPKRISDFFGKLADKNVRYLHVDEPGLPNARNVSTKKAKGDVVLFIDDDTKPLDQHFIKYHAENYSEPHIVGVAGRIIDPRYEKESDPGRILKLTKWGTIREGKNGIVRTEVDVLSGGNMSFRKRDAICSGLFDTDIIGTFQAEEMTFSLKLRKNSKKKFIFDPRAALYHFALSSGGDYSRSVALIYRDFCRFHNLTVNALKNKREINILLFIITRLIAAIRIAIRDRSTRSFWWLIRAMYHGFLTVYRQHPPSKLQLKKLLKVMKGELDGIP